MPVPNRPGNEAGDSRGAELPVPNGNRAGDSGSVMSSSGASWEVVVFLDGVVEVLMDPVKGVEACMGSSWSVPLEVITKGPTECVEGLSLSTCRGVAVICAPGGLGLLPPALPLLLGCASAPPQGLEVPTKEELMRPG